MYEELVKRLRYCAISDNQCSECKYHGGSPDGSKMCLDVLMEDAADAIEELQQTVKHYKGCADDWYRDACAYKAICEQMKATTIVEAQHTEMYDERDKQTLMEMVKSLPLHIIPNKDEKPRWVSVTERLPEERDYYLVFTQANETYVCDFIPSVNQWWIDPCDIRLGNVTHWMPLPEPPKEE